MSAPAAPPTDRRIAPRRQPAMGTVCRLDEGAATPALGLVWNISTTGLSLLLPDPRDSGTTIAGRLEAEVGGHVLPVRFRVIHVKKLGTGDYFIGAQFDRPLTDDEMRPFVA